MSERIPSFVLTAEDRDLPLKGGGHMQWYINMVAVLGSLVTLVLAAGAPFRA
jgi:hypothetical protein